VVLQAIVIVGLHRAYALWVQVHQRLSSEEVRTLVAVAKSCAEDEMNLDPARVEDPLTGWAGDSG
jgi:hypothetical protein